MKCPTCEYEIDPVEQESCPRCGSTISCGMFDCGSCGACSGSLVGVGRGFFGSQDDGG